MAVIQATDADFTSLLESNEKVVVKYYADWCGSCRLFAPKFKKLSGLPENEGVVFVDINAETNPEARKMAGVDNLPFIATFHNGKRVEGASTSKEEFVQQLIHQMS